MKIKLTHEELEYVREQSVMMVLDQPSNKVSKLKQTIEEMHEVSANKIFGSKGKYESNIGQNQTRVEETVNEINETTPNFASVHNRTEEAFFDNQLTCNTKIKKSKTKATIQVDNLKSVKSDEINN